MSPANFGCLLNSLRIDVGPVGGLGKYPYPDPADCTFSLVMGDARLLQYPDFITNDLSDSVKRHLYKSVRVLIFFSF